MGDDSDPYGLHYARRLILRAAEAFSLHHHHPDQLKIDSKLYH